MIYKGRVIMSNNKEVCTFLWFIENYSYCWHENGESLVSPVFTVSKLQNTAWSILLYPRGYKEKYRGMISIRLERNNNGPDSIAVKYEIAIVAEDESTLLSNSSTNEFSKNTRLGWSLADMDGILSRKRSEYLPKDILIIRCRLWKVERNADAVAPICARTRIGIEHISYLHTVGSFSGLKPNQKVTYQIHSPKQKKRVKSCIYISDGACCEEQVMVEITASRPGLILAKYELFLIETSGKRVKCAEADNRFDVKRKEIGKMHLSLTKDAIMKEKRIYLPDDNISLLCECIFSIGIEFQQIEGAQCEANSIVERLIPNCLQIKYGNIPTEKFSACSSALDDLEGIYNSKFLTDVELKTKTNSFPAHKVVLCARSPVFKAMMSHETLESNSGTILVDDLEDDTIEKLLLFLYTDNVKDLEWESAIQLYSSADKYLIEKLKLICSSFLIDNISISTATELLLLADIHSDSDLKKTVEDFILDYDEQVFGSEKWEKLMEENSQLALKTMHLKYKTKKVCK